MAENFGEVGKGIKLENRSTNPSSPENGQVWYNSGFKFYEGGTTKTLSSGASSGASGINYISNPDFETNTTGWSTYADTAGSSPVDGTGGSATTTFARNTSSPLRSTADGILTKDAANRQGEGVSYDFSIDNQDKSKRIWISFDYAGSSNFVSGESSDVKIFIYDVTNTALISVTKSYLLNASGSFLGYFDASTSTSYRLIFHISTTNANAWTFNVDNISVGPKQVVTGMAGSDFTNETGFTFDGFGTVTNSSVWSRRVGDSIEVRGFFNCGTTTATNASITFPSKFIIDSTKYASTSNSQGIGSGVKLTAGSTTIDSGDTYSLFYDGSTTTKVFITDNVTGNTFNKTNASSMFSSGQGFSFYFRFSQSGYSTNLVLSNSSSFFISSVIANGTRVTSAPAVIGEYRTYVKSSSATSGTDNAPSDSPSISNGMLIYSVPYGSAGTSGQINRWEIFVGKNKYIKTEFYQSAGKTGYVSTDLNTNGTADFYGLLKSYDPVTGILVVDSMIQYSSVSSRYVGYGIGTAGGGRSDLTSCYFDVTVSENALAVGLQSPRSEIRLSTANGYGSTNTKIRRYTTADKNTGAAMTYADSATLGMSITINEDGLYSMHVSEAASGGNEAAIGFTLNATGGSLTTTIYNINAPTRLNHAFAIVSGTSVDVSVSWSGYLSKGDIIRAHGNGGTSGVTSYCQFSIVKLSD